MQVNAHNMGFTSDEVMILYQLIRAYIDINEWDKAQNRLSHLLALASASDMQEFVARGLWLQSILATHNQRYDEAIEIINQAAQVAHETNSRLVQFPIQIQRAHIYQCAANLTAAREAVTKAQTSQGDLLNHLASAEIRQTFLTHSYADKLREIAGAVAVAPTS